MLIVLQIGEYNLNCLRTIARAGQTKRLRYRTCQAKIGKGT